MNPAGTDSVARRPAAQAVRHGIPSASIGETIAILLEVLLPTIAKGPIIRRPAMLALAERFGWDDRAVRRLQRVRARHQEGPLLLNFFGRKHVLLLEPVDVQRVLEASPEPFATASTEKRAALAHFEPRGALISHGPDRTERRRFNERVLEHHEPTHRFAERFVQMAEEEAGHAMALAGPRRELTWPVFASAWFRLVRRVVFGDAAREDEELRRMIDRLRAHGNWGFLWPRHHALREKFFARMQYYVSRAEPDSLARIVAELPATGRTAPLDQIPQYLFAFDPAGMTTFRSLALLASHPDAEARAREEAAARNGPARIDLPFLRSTVLESLRLWPTTPLVLRETTRETTWRNGVVPAGTGVIIFAPFFHRDEERVAFAHRFTPEIWRDGRVEGRTVDWPLVPFSAGPAICPGRHIVLLVTSAMLASLLERGRFRLARPARLDTERLPGTLNHYALRFAAY